MNAAYKEGDCVKMKLKLQEADLEALRGKLCETEDKLTDRYSKQAHRIICIIFENFIIQTTSFSPLFFLFLSMCLVRRSRNALHRTSGEVESNAKISN